MPSGAEHHAGKTTKMLLIGDSGSGKTGALFSLLKAGYKLWIMDFDNGLDVLINIVKKNDPKLLHQIEYETLTDPSKVVAGRTMQTSKAWETAFKLFNTWKVEELGEKDIIVIDSLNFAGKAAVRFVQKTNNTLINLASWTEFGTAQKLLEQFCGNLYSESVKCNVIGLTHIKEVGKKVKRVDAQGRETVVEDPDTRKGYPDTGTGSALESKIGRYFNTILMMDIQGSGPLAKRIIRTVPHMDIGLKNSAPGTVAAQYPIENGLADYFKAVRGEV